GLVSFSEPMLRLFNQGVILGEDGEKMSKSRGNVVNPDEYVNSVGADTVRAYLMFIGAMEGGGPWNSRGIEGVHRFLQRGWNVVHETNGNPHARPAGSGRSAGTGEQGNADPQPAARSGSRSRDPAFPRSRDNRELAHWTHKTIKKVTGEVEGTHFKTSNAMRMRYEDYRTREKSRQRGSRGWREANRWLI